ncbi:tripartite tricarboxylate transporter TctB family protein [Halostagnicola sp. A-GB9-2]|uniref:tripartite tricarboxylate transporter TctB family protein n=1 Tax=Halostagnicola sp. A-GB9-2 TaxID=3048066 RepID=UPI0024BFD6CB|nr:tripartite tricarboxylate transporter TctB family protein [Halostagnicola sp. A-GB9-2]MDJ1433685.1 tripartite tricarboxylate transporter TctB family protein [Halostagnicola sp. A-GB9-2]
MALTKLKSNPLSVIFILVSVVVIAYATRFPDGGELGPGFFPILVSAAIIVFAVADIVVDDDTELEISDFSMVPAAVMFGFLTAYLLLMPYTGFLVGTMLFLPVGLYYSNIRSKLMITVISIGLPIVLFYIFSDLFMVRLPEAIIPVSRLLPPLPL